MTAAQRRIPQTLTDPRSAIHRKPPANKIPTIPGYEILGTLGQGGMGIVFKARDVKLKRLVALKMILSESPHPASETIERFRAEAAAIARLQHANIVQVYEIDEHDGKPFFSLEFVEGGSLDRRLAKAPMPPRDAAHLCATITRAMQAVHQRGVIHRDLKPANILLTGSPAIAIRDCTPKITDFGLAKQLDEVGPTLSGAIMGTPSYMAPEQASGLISQIGPGTDVYALGAILYECLTGKPPFRASTLLETLEQVRSQAPVAVRRLQPKVPQDLATICSKCLEKEPVRRYPAARAPGG